MMLLNPLEMVIVASRFNVPEKSKRVITCAAIEDHRVEVCVCESAQFNIRGAGFITEDRHFAWIGLGER